MSSRTLLVDNYDSFTYNLFTLLTEVNGVVPTVVRNDADWDSLDLASYDNVVISPGPAGRIATVISESAAVSSRKRLSHFSVSVSATRACASCSARMSWLRPYRCTAGFR